MFDEWPWLLVDVAIVVWAIWRVIMLKRRDKPLQIEEKIATGLLLMLAAFILLDYVM